MPKLISFFSNRLNFFLKDIASACKHSLSYILRHYWLYHTLFELVFPDIFYIILSSQIFLCLPVWQMNVSLMFLGNTSPYVFQDCLWTAPWPSEWLKGVRCRGYFLLRAHPVRGLLPEEGIRWELGCVKPLQWFMLVQDSWSKGLESPSRAHKLHL